MIPSKGKIQLQTELAEFFVRRWELWPLGTAVGPVVVLDELPGGAVGAPYNQVVSAKGASALTWSLASGTLPPGLTLSPSTGQIAGTPTTGGTFNFSARVTDAGGALATQPFQIAVAASGGTLVSAGLVLHLDSTQGVTTTGNTATAWADQSGSGNHLSAVSNPQLGTVPTPSGLTSIRLDRVNDALQRTTTLTGFPSGNPARTIFMVGKYNSATWWGGVSYGADGSNQPFGLNVSHPTGELVLHGNGGSNDLVSTIPGAGAGWMVQSGLVAGSVGTLFKDGAQLGQFTHTYDTVLTKMVIGSDMGNGGFVGMDVAAVVLYDRALSVSERADVDAYLRSKYLVDTTPPTITVPANIAVEATGSSGAVVSFSTSAVDDVSGLLTPTITPASGSLFPFATTTVTTSAVDAAGNPASGSFTVTVVDTTPPVITLVGADPLILWVGEAFEDPGATASDVVGGNLTASIVPGGQAVDINTPGSYMRTYTVSDPSANTGQTQRTALVVPSTAPALQFEMLHNPTDDLRIGFNSVLGLDYELHTSVDLIDWELLETRPGNGLPAEMLHPGGGADPRRFYKVVATKSGQ